MGFGHFVWEIFFVLKIQIKIEQICAKYCVTVEPALMWALTKGNWLHYPINDNNIRNNSIPTWYITLLSVNFPLPNWSHKPNDNIISDHITLWPTDIKMISQIQLQTLIRVYLEKQTNYSIFKVICNLCYKSCQSLAQSFLYNQ